jgi:malate dehydrogenase
MSRNQALSLAMQAYRQMATGKAATQPRKVAVLGAAGGIGQSLSMLMKASEDGGVRAAGASRSAAISSLHPARPQMNPAVTELALYDVVNVPGVAADVSHVNTRAVVKVRSWWRLPQPP